MGKIVPWEGSFFQRHPKWRRFWQRYEAVGLSYFHWDDTSEYSIELPAWPWRWVCWLNRGHQAVDHPRHGKTDCVICRKHFRVTE